MCNDTPFSCKRGGILECNLFAKVYKVNVAIHQDTNDPAEGPPMHRARYAALSCKLVPEGALCVSQIRCVSDMDYPT